MTFLEAKDELSDFLALRKEIMLIENLEEDLHNQSLKSPKLDSVGFSKFVTSDDQLVQKTDKLNRLDEQLQKLKDEEKNYLQRLQAVNSKHSAVLAAVYYVGYKLSKVSAISHYSKSEMSRKLSRSIQAYADLFDRPLKY